MTKEFFERDYGRLDDSDVRDGKNHSRDEDGSVCSLGRR
jgi:hypothetical protein